MMIGVDEMDKVDEVDVMDKVGADEMGPGYYRSGGLQAWDLWSAWGLDPYLANAVKYIVRAGRKDEDAASAAKDLRKAIHYLRKRMELRLVIAPRWADAPEASALDAVRAFGLSAARVHALTMIRLSAASGPGLVVEQLEAACGALEGELAALGGGRGGRSGRGGRGKGL